MPRERPSAPPFEADDLGRSLERYLASGLIFMLVLIGGFFAYKAREPALRRDATAEQTRSYVTIGTKLFARDCASCHGKRAIGGSAPTLDAKEFLGETTDAQIRALVAVGVAGTDMPAWGIDFGGNFTDEQVNQLVAYLRSLAPHAPSVPGWREGRTAASS